VDLGAVVRACSPWDASSFDPGAHIRAVAALVGAAEDRVVAGLREVVGSFDGDDDPRFSASRLTLLLRTLFDPPSGGALPNPLSGAPGDPADPRWPMTLVDDLPLLVVPRSPPIRGLAQSAASDLEAVITTGRLRRRPLRPPDDPAAAVAKLTPDQQAVVQPQIARLIS
jgi:hypothetical protein